MISKKKEWLRIHCLIGTRNFGSMKYLIILVCLLTGTPLSAQETETYQLEEVRIGAIPPVFTESTGSFGQQLYRYFAKNITYPPAAIEKRADGKCYALFTIARDGSVKDVSIARGVHDCPECDSVVLAALLKMPSWKPIADTSSETRYMLPVRFDPSDILPVVEKDPVIYGEEPEFPGGRKALLAYLKKAIVYPEKAAAAGIGGKVYLKFIVTDEGEIRDVKVSRGIPECPECDAEAVRVVKAMPLWIPYAIKGEPVHSYMSLPIRFDPKTVEADGN